MIRHHVDRIPRMRQQSVHADIRIRRPTVFRQRQRMLCQIRRAHRVDPLLRKRRMGTFPVKGDLLPEISVEIVDRKIAAGMIHQRKIHIVKDSAADQFRFPAVEVDFPFRAESFHKIRIQRLLRRNADQRNPSGTGVRNPGGGKADRRPDQRGDVTVVPARMNRSGDRIRRRMRRKNQGVHLAEQSDGRSLFPRLQIRTEPRHGKTAFHLQTQFFQSFRRFLRGPHLAVSGFRMIPDVGSEVHHFFAMAVNFLADPCFEFVQFHKAPFPDENPVDLSRGYSNIGKRRNQSVSPFVFGESSGEGGRSSESG